MDEPRQDVHTDARVLAMRDSGATWLEIQQEFDFSRQQARHAYQRAKRVERRAHQKGD